MSDRAGVYEKVTCSNSMRPCGSSSTSGFSGSALCSSTSAFTGSFGSVAYTAANAFLDAMADTSTGVPVVSINWHRWQGVGMAIETERLHERIHRVSVQRQNDPDWRPSLRISCCSLSRDVAACPRRP